MSERTSRQAITQVAAALFAQGAAERVDRRRDAQAARRDAPRHGLHLRRPRHRHALPDDHGRGAHVHAAALGQVAGRRGRSTRAPTPFVDVVARALGLPVAAGDRDRRRRLPVRAPAVGQRQQRRRPRARRGLHLRPQHADQHPAAQGRGRGDHHRGRRARPRSRRRPLHDLPDHPRARGASESSPTAPGRRGSASPAPRRVGLDHARRSCSRRGGPRAVVVVRLVGRVDWEAVWDALSHLAWWQPCVLLRGAVVRRS